jgi:gamma-glutamylaminecyclotransferase
VLEPVVKELVPVRNKREVPLAAAAAGVGEKHRVFVYGSLRQGFGNHKYYLQGRADFQGEGLTAPEYTLLNLGAFPGVVKAGNTAITGEVYGVSEGLLRELDRLEGHPNFYRRTPITLQDGREVEMYILGNHWNGSADARQIVLSGDWKKRV